LAVLLLPRFEGARTVASKIAHEPSAVQRV
jgi:hypothetical protein